MKTKLIPFFLLLLIVGACGEKDSEVIGEFSSAGDDLFPLKVGNSWEYQPASTNWDKTIVQSSITKLVILENKEYYLMVSKWIGNGSTTTDSVYYRIDGNGYVFQRKTNGETSNPFRLAANDGDQWKSSALSTENDRRVTFIDPITIYSQQLSDCLLFAFDIDHMADEEQYTIIAPGFGIVSTYSAWGFRKDLKKAIIDGITYHF